MSSIDKEIARDITVAWISSGKLSEEYLTKKQVAAFYETIFTTVIECRAQPKGMQIDTSGGTITATTKSGSTIRSTAGRRAGGDVSRHRF